MELSKFLTSELGVEVFFYQGRFFVEQEDESFKPHTREEILELMESKDPVCIEERYYNEREYGDELDFEDYTG